MSHEIDMSNNRANIAFVGELPWHGLGQQLTETADLNVWCKEAGMDWTIEKAPVQYTHPVNGTVTVTGRNVLYRSDTSEPLSIMTDSYKIVQPKEVLEFFSDLISGTGMKMETAGCLYGGKRFWALANTGEAANILKDDTVKGYVLLTSSCDGSLATIAQLTTVRVVCNNTLTLSLSSNSKRTIKTSHLAEFNPDKVKQSLGLVDAAWHKFISQARDMANTKVSNDVAEEFFNNLMIPKHVAKSGTELSDNAKRLIQKHVDDLMYRFNNGVGAEYHAGNAWGLINAVTEFVDHGNSRRSVESRFMNSLLAVGSDLKDRAFAEALAI